MSEQSLDHRLYRLFLLTPTTTETRQLMRSYSVWKREHPELLVEVLQLRCCLLEAMLDDWYRDVYAPLRSASEDTDTLDLELPF